MNKDDIIKYVHKLDWSYPVETQNKAIDISSKIDEEYVSFIFDKNQKSTWENAVRVIREIGFPKNKPLLPNLVWLLQDINWPGALEAMEILSSIEKTIVLPIIEKALLMADANADSMWIAGINLLVKKAGYKSIDFSDEKIYEILDKADF